MPVLAKTKEWSLPTLIQSVLVSVVKSSKRCSSHSLLFLGWVAVVQYMSGSQLMPLRRETRGEEGLFVVKAGC